jgi:hypothetical protein
MALDLASCLTKLFKRSPIITPMKVLDLQCTHHHVFEGWFASEEDFQNQLARGLVSCPMCSDIAVSKKLSAPRLNLGAVREDIPNAAPVPEVVEPSTAMTNLPEALPEPVQVQAALLKMARHVLANTEDVGQKFAEEARKIHYGDAQQRSIRGHASAEETKELLDEGIAVLPLPLPDAVKETLQ